MRSVTQFGVVYAAGSTVNHEWSFPILCRYHGATNKDVVIKVCSGGEKLSIPSKELARLGCPEELYVDFLRVHGPVSKLISQGDHFCMLEPHTKVELF